MIGDVLVFLRRELDQRLQAELGVGADAPSGDKVVFVDGGKMDPIAFQLGAVTALLINFEEERALRRPDPYLRKTEDGTTVRVKPDLRLALNLLFVARFKKYEDAWTHLSRIMEHFQTVNVFEPKTHPELPEGVDKLVVELVTFGLSEQNEVWSALRTSHHPSILYRVQLIALRDRRPQPVTAIEESVANVRRIP